RRQRPRYAWLETPPFRPALAGLDAGIAPTARARLSDCVGCVAAPPQTQERDYGPQTTTGTGSAREAYGGSQGVNTQPARDARNKREALAEPPTRAPRNGRSTGRASLRT